MTPPGRIVQLATDILEHTTGIQTYLDAHGIPSPSFEPGTLPKLPLPPALEDTLGQALSALDELNALLLGPLGWLKNQIDHAYDLVSLHAMYRFDVPSKIPLGADIPIGELARKCNGDNNLVERLLQHAVSNYLLIQPRPGYVAHSSTSTLLAQEPAFKDWVGTACEDMWPAGTKVIDALTKWPGAPALPHQTGHNLVENTAVPFFQTLEGDPDRARRFANTMWLMQKMPGFEPSAALDAFDWAALGESTVVDIGGSTGDFARELTKKNPKLHIVVQDLPNVIEKARSNFTRDSSSNITLKAHDFFTPQPVQGADVYFFRMILHDWPEESCTQILRQLIPSLKPGARVLVNDICMPPVGTLPRYQERQIRCQDIAMMAMFNSQERSSAQWARLIERADPRFHLQSVVQLPSSHLGLLQVIWMP
ncbi:hypothetical protein JX266_005565 [Neoarthrinium moseri]|nr:hypothetical protein JX266_005565 [Neoarthrinium moseri]